MDTPPPQPLEPALPPSATSGQAEAVASSAPTAASQVRAFLAWPAAASAITLLSAAVLLGSAYGLIAPAIGDPEGVGTRLSAIAVLAAYLGALLGVIWLMCRWEAGNPDAIGASVVGAPLIVGLGVSLDLVAVERPGLTAVAAIACLSGALFGWGAWNRATGGRTPRGAGLPLLLVTIWSFAWPALLGLEDVMAKRHPDLAALHPMLLWIPGWWIVLAAGAWALVALLRGADPWGGGDRPFLGRPAMRWIALLLVLVASGVHQYVLGYTANLDFQWSDFAPLLALIALIGNEMRARGHGQSAAWDAAALFVPAALLVACVAGADPEDAMNRGPELARHLLMAQSPEATLIALALLGALLWWRGRREGMLIGAGGAAVAIALVWTVPPGGSLHGLAAMATAVILCGAYAVIHRRARLALAAILAAEAGASLVPRVAERLDGLGLSPAVVDAAVIGLTMLTAVMWRPQLLPAALIRAAAWSWTIGGMWCLVLGHGGPHHPLLASVGVSAILLVAAWRCQDRWLLAPLSVPACLAAPYLMPANKAWLGIWAAFALLGSALVVGWHRIRQAPAERMAKPG